jgi:SAM-dependent methyltransferase
MPLALPPPPCSKLEAMTAFPPFLADRTPIEADGVLLLPSVSTAEDQDYRTRFDRLVRTAREIGWRPAIEQVFNADWDIDYITSQQRLGFLPVLPLAASQAVLEIGASLGQIALPIARQVATLDAMEVVEGQARFCAERLRQEGLDNVRVVAGGGDCLLPYADAGFDGVVLNLVLEWCADRDSGDHASGQQRLLDEIARVLKPGGFFFVQTKNRYGLRLLLGGRDEHMFNRRFGSALPRRLGRLVAGARPPGMLHSFSRLRSMLAGAGFRRIDGYWAAPEMRRPEAMVPVDAAAIRAFRREGKVAQGASRKTRLIMALLPAWAVRHVTQGLTFLAYK